MKPMILELDIILQEATFFASHEIHNLYLTEGVIGNYALAYALGFVRSPYDRKEVGYLKDLPLLNDQSIYVTPAWPTKRVRYRTEQFNCQSESYYGAMENNAVVEITGRQYIQPGTKGKEYVTESGKRKKIRAINRPQLGILKMLCPENKFKCHVISQQKISVPQYVRLGKFMSKAKITVEKLVVHGEKQMEQHFNLINPLDLPDDCQILFGDTINIHPTPLLRKALLRGRWYIDGDGKSIAPAAMRFRGLS